ncbi:MAG: thioredoxin family protein [Desulfurococcaceae archaeon]|uniref:Thioredoxin n=1 Tax=Staphylothermus marinus TaxID=2280 RepID=A0A7C4NNX9_STAMA
MLEIRNREEFNRALLSNEVVFVQYYSSINNKFDFIREVIKRLCETIDPRILVLSINIDESPELARDTDALPCFRVYYNGKMVFEQIDFFYQLDLDLSVLRRGIRSVFNSLNVNYRV